MKMNRRTDVVQLSGCSFYQPLTLTLSGTRPTMTVVERTSAMTPAMSMTTPTGSITCMSASLNGGLAAENWSGLKKFPGYSEAELIGQPYNIFSRFRYAACGITQQACP